MSNFDKMLSKQSKKRDIERWWNKNKYTFMKIIFFPVWIFVLAMDKIGELNRKRERDLIGKNFSEEKCKKMLDKAVPKLALASCRDISKLIMITTVWDAGGINFRDFEDSSHLSKREIKYFRRCSPYLNSYITYDYQIDGYSKMVVGTTEEWRAYYAKFYPNVVTYPNMFKRKEVGVVFWKEGQL